MECLYCNADMPDDGWLVTKTDQHGHITCGNCGGVMEVEHECGVNDYGDCDEWLVKFQEPTTQRNG